MTMVTKVGVSLPDDLYEDVESIREAMGEESPLGNEPDRSRVFEQALRAWVEEHREYLDD